MEFVSWSLCQLFVQCEYTYLATNECKQCPTLYFTHLHTWHFQVRSDLSNYHLKLLELCFTWQTPHPFQSHKQVGRNPFFAVVSHANDIYMHLADAQNEEWHSSSCVRALERGANCVRGGGWGLSKPRARAHLPGNTAFFSQSLDLVVRLNCALCANTEIHTMSRRWVEEKCSSAGGLTFCCMLPVDNCMRHSLLTAKLFKYQQ
jgi:hypothetical protein